MVNLFIKNKLSIFLVIKIKKHPYLKAFKHITFKGFFSFGMLIEFILTV